MRSKHAPGERSDKWFLWGRVVNEPEDWKGVGEAQLVTFVNENKAIRRDAWTNQSRSSDHGEHSY